MKANSETIINALLDKCNAIKEQLGMAQVIGTDKEVAEATAALEAVESLLYVAFGGDLVAIDVALWEREEEAENESAD